MQQRFDRRLIVLPFCNAKWHVHVVESECNASHGDVTLGQSFVIQKKTICCAAGAGPGIAAGACSGLHMAKLFAFVYLSS